MATLIAEVVAFLIVVFVVYRYIWPILQRMMEQRQDVVQQQVDDSQEAARRLRQAEQRFDAAAAEARNEAARIRDDARADSQLIREELREQADREAERIRQRGEEQLVAMREQTVRQLRVELGGLSMRLAEQIVVESLSDDGRRRSTVDRFLADLDQMPGRGDAERATTPARPTAAGGGAN